MTLSDYWMKRDRLFASELTADIVGNAAVLIERVHKLLKVFGEERDITSGWRPPAVNGNTPGAALKSKHMTGQAVDLADPDGDLDEWCLEHQDMLELHKLWLEHPSATKGWCHLQSIPPKSGKRVFYP
jgi:hypothetical protein